MDGIFYLVSFVFVTAKYPRVIALVEEKIGFNFKVRVEPASLHQKLKLQFIYE